MKFLKLIIMCAIGTGCASISAMDNTDDQSAKALEAAQRATDQNQGRNTFAIMFDVCQKIKPYINVELVPDLLARLIDGDESAVHALIKAINSEKLAKAIKPQDYEQLTRDLAELKAHYLKHGTVTPAIKVPKLTFRSPAQIDNYITSRMQISLANYTPRQIHQLRGAVIGIGGIVTLWLLGHAFLHSAMELMEPTHLAAGAWLMTMAYVLYQVIEKVSDRSAYRQLITDFVAPLVAAFDKQRSQSLVAQHAATPTVAVPANHIILAAPPQPADLSVWDTLSPAQRALVSVDQLEEYKKSPQKAMANTAFLAALTLEQVNALSKLVLG